MSFEMSEGFEISVRGPEGRTEKLSVHCNRLVIGSGAHCEVRLPVGRAAVEHVELTVANGRVRARACAFDPAPTIGGSPFVEAFVEPGMAVGVGPFQIVALPRARAGASDESKAKFGVRKPLGVAVVFAALALLGVSVAARGSADAAGTPIEAPPLWGAPVASCPQAAASQALALAHERQTLAEGKRERRPFQVRDGVVAVPLFETASACYAAGGDPALATAASQAATDLRSKVQGDYHAHQVRLEHALFVHDLPTATREVKVLRAFTDGIGGPYTAWLSDLDRRLQLELAKEHTT